MWGKSYLARARSGISRLIAHSPFRPLIADDRGNVLIIAALVLPALLGTLGLAFETGNWYQVKRAMQNAADSAVIAAASNGGANYATEAKAVAAQYGFQDGVNGVTVTVSNAAACPAGGTTCYSVTISASIKLVLSKLVGFNGDTVKNGSRAQNISATAIANQTTSPRNYCVLALAGSGASQGIRTNGAPFADLNGCDVMSNTDAVCNGHNLNAGHGDAHGSSSGCGTSQTSHMPALADSYSSLASNIPANTCSSYPQEPAKKKDPDLPSSNQLSGSLSWSGVQRYCGDVQLTGNVTITTPTAGAVLVIYNGQLDTNGYTLKTASGSSLTIVFSGDNTSGYTHAPTGGGTIDIAAPASGNWSGVAIYQDPALTNGVDVSAAGNSPTWNITGLVYLPHSSVTFSGAVNKSTNGLSCFVLVVDNVTINGTGSILSEGQCTQAGLTMPTGQVVSRGSLVS
jgi:Flp pilus assembly protein TadG